jgi:peptide deformylase
MEVLLWPNPILKTVSTDCTEWPEQSVLDEMHHLLSFKDGLGLSAIQVGIPKNFFIYNVGRVSGVYVNPKWKPIKTSKTHLVKEGCLSIPGFFETVSRYDTVEVQHLLQDGTTRSDFVYNTIIAQVIQHEIFHLRGQMFIEQAPKGAVDRARQHMLRVKK